MGVVPEVRVELYVGIDRDAPYLTLDDPVKGVLNATPYTIADTAALDLTGDIEFVLRVALDDWVTGSDQVMVGKAPSPGVSGYSFRVTSTGELLIAVGDGTSRSTTSTVAPTATNGEPLWLKGTIDVDDGAGNRVANFYTAPDQEDEPTTWTQLGATVTNAPNVVITTNSLDLHVGETATSTAPAAGDYYRVIVRDGIGGTAVVDETSYPLYDGALPSITASLEADAYAYSVRRGRSSELDDVSTGTCAISFRNFAGAFVPYTLVDARLRDGSGEVLTDGDGNPLYADWATYGWDTITPGRRVRLYLDEVCVFDGNVDDWQLSYDKDLSCSAELVAFDALGTLAQTTLEEFTTSSQTASERIEAVLDLPEVDFGANRAVGDSTDPVDDLVVPAGTNTITYIRKVVYSDLGYVYASRLGLLTFEPRSSVTYTVAAEFADDGTAIPFDGIVPSSTSRYLYNRVTVTRAAEDAVEQVAEDTASQAIYGVRTLSLDDMLMNSDTDALNLAGSLLSFYKEPATRIESLSVNLGSLTSEQRATVCALELGDFVTVTWTPTGTDEVTQSLRIEGIDWGGSYNSLGMLTLSLSPATYYPFPFILDDLTDGVLDTSTIYY